VVPPKGFLTAIKDIAKEFDALFIADEMITGFGRTGKMWGVDHDDVTPDVMTLGKGIGGGFPMSAVASRKELAEAKPFGNPSGSSSSYGGNPMASAAGRASLEVITRENLVENSQKVGLATKKRLMEFQEECKLVGDVRGEGLMIGMDLVKDRKTKELLDKKWTRQIYHECLNRGLICMSYNPIIRINPPLIIKEQEALEAVEILIESIKIIEKKIV
jgi:4-aminobutyrate aminotransferase-like enzyme